MQNMLPSVPGKRLYTPEYAFSILISEMNLGQGQNNVRMLR